MMDEQRALKVITEFLELLDRSHVRPVGGLQAEVLPDKGDEIERRLPLIRKIAEHVDSDLASLIQQGQRGIDGWSWHGARSAVQRLIGHLESRVEAEAILGPAGPALSAQSLHPMVWNAAARLWAGNNFRAAVQAAATAVEVELQAKSGLSAQGKTLASRAFEEPTDGSPRLHFLGYEAGSANATSLREGAKFYAMGCMQLIRNLATHDPDEFEEQDALERLAALSLLARLIDRSEVHGTEGP